jgi:hypothetical protein
MAQLQKAIPVAAPAPFKKFLRVVIVVSSACSWIFKALAD